MSEGVEVEFKGAVIDVTVTVGAHSIRITRRGDTWTGQDEALELGGDETHVVLKFVAPSFTDWELKVTYDGETLLEANGTSDRQRFSFEKTVKIR